MSEEQVLMRFEGLRDRIIPASALGGWPMPDRLAHFPMTDAWAVPDGLDLPADVVTFYRKVSESQITDEHIASMDYVMRGAQYEIEKSVSEQA